MHHLIKHGYDEYAEWETFDWFINTMKPILTNYRNNHIGVPPVIMDYSTTFETDEENQAWEDEMEAKWNAIIDKMIELLDLMGEDNPKYNAEEYDKDWKKKDIEMDAAKDEFFKLFAKYFYYLWD
jgi:hypothetical protein